VGAAKRGWRADNFSEEQSSNTEFDNGGDGAGQREGDLTSTELPRASRRTNLSRPVARSFTRSTDAATPAIPRSPTDGEEAPDRTPSAPTARR
jgi:hypothetical protein